jgi:hypothetical protein
MMALRTARVVDIALAVVLVLMAAPLGAAQQQRELGYRQRSYACSTALHGTCSMYAH